MLALALVTFVAALSATVAGSAAAEDPGGSTAPPESAGANLGAPVAEAVAQTPVAPEPVAIEPAPAPAPAAEPPPEQVADEPAAEPPAPEEAPADQATADETGAAETGAQAESAGRENDDENGDRDDENGDRDDENGDRDDENGDRDDENGDDDQHDGDDDENGDDQNGDRDDENGDDENGDDRDDENGDDENDDRGDENGENDEGVNFARNLAAFDDRVGFDLPALKLVGPCDDVLRRLEELHRSATALGETLSSGAGEQLSNRYDPPLHEDVVRIRQAIADVILDFSPTDCVHTKLGLPDAEERLRGLRSGVEKALGDPQAPGSLGNDASTLLEVIQDDL